MSRRAKEDGVAQRASDEGVRRGIAGARIGFDLDDASGEKLAPLAPDEDFAEKIRADEARIAVVEGARKGVEVRFHRGANNWRRSIRSPRHIESLCKCLRRKL